MVQTLVIFSMFLTDYVPKEILAWYGDTPKPPAAHLQTHLDFTKRGHVACLRKPLPDSHRQTLRSGTSDTSSTGDTDRRNGAMGDTSEGRAGGRTSEGHCGCFGTGHGFLLAPSASSVTQIRTTFVLVP